MKVEVKLTLVIEVEDDQLENIESNKEDLFDRIEEDLFATLATESEFQGSDDVDYPLEYKSIMVNRLEKLSAYQG